MGELDKTVAIVFKRKGKSLLSEREFINTILFDLRWSDPGKSPKITAVDAQKILDAAKVAGLLTINEGALKPTFDYKAIDIPLNYQPSKAVIAEAGTRNANEPASAPVVKAEPKPEVSKTTEIVKEPAAVQPPSEASQQIDVPLFSVLIEDIALGTGMKKKELVAKINKLHERLHIVPEVAALLVARDSGMDISKYYSVTKEEIKNK